MRRLGGLEREGRIDWIGEREPGRVVAACLLENWLVRIGLSEVAYYSALECSLD